MRIYDRFKAGVAGIAGMVFGSVSDPMQASAVRRELDELRGRYQELITADYAGAINNATKGLGDFSNETREIRAQYRKYFQTDGTVKSAILGKVADVLSNKLSIVPADKDDPIQKEEADFCEKALADVKGGFDLKLLDFGLALLIDGWALSEKLLDDGPVGNRPHAWKLGMLKSKDTENLVPVCDEYRNILGFESFKDGSQTFGTDAFMYSAYLPLFESPTGTSDIRAAYSAVKMKIDAIRLRMIFLDKFTGPYIHGKYGDKNRKAGMIAALKEARASGILVTEVTDDVKLLDLAARGTADFKTAIEDLDKQIVISIHGAFLHMLEGNVSNARGNSNTQERTSKAFKWLFARYIEVAVRDHLLTPIMRFNFGPSRPVPYAQFEAISPAEVLANLQIDQALSAMGVPLSFKALYAATGRTPPLDEADTLKPAVPLMQGQQLASAPGGGGTAPFDQGKAAPVAKFSEGPRKVGVSDIRIDPERFQFRRNKDGESGTVKSRKIEALDPATMKPLLLWLDPADGLTYLVDGHHRVEAAKAQGIAELPAEFIQAADAEEAKRIGKEANRVQDAAKFAEESVVKPGSEIALAGRDGKAAAGLMQKCIDDGKAALELATRGMAERSLNAGKAVPFTAEESKLIQDSIASTLATSELLGRSRIREKATKAEAAGGLYKLSEEQPFSTFAELPNFAGFKPLPPERAADYFTSLVPSLDIDARAFAAAAERQAFTLAAATEEVILNRVRDSLASNLATGGAQGGFRDVQSILDSAGVSPANPQYAEMVYRTNMMDAYNVGQQRELQADDMKDMFPVWQYLGIDDGRQGSDHAPKFNRYYPASANFAEVRGDRPFNCRCTSTPIDKYTWEEDLKPAGAVLETSW